MGEVFRARDSRLDRMVAIKILPSHLAVDPEFRERFEREARTISQLNHPHICTLHDVGENYLVMELLEGETLADRILRGPLPMHELLRIGAQIAEALEKAHRCGVIHRDLKPGNVMLTKSGAKLLDFGLAKIRGIVSFDTDGPTEHKPLTREGTILGTFQYMAPEQLEGEEADPRTDIFALGAVLYEMATGKRAFDGRTRTSLIAAIVSGTPRPINELQPMTPTAFEHVVAKCLEKDPEDRWQSAQDIAGQLRWIATQESQAGIAATRGRTGGGGWLRGFGVAALGIGIPLALLSGWLWRRVGVAENVVRAEIVPPPQLPMASLIPGALALSPDGKRIAFLSGSRAEVTTLAVRDLESGETRALQGTGRATFPFWSPDSRTIAFFAEGKLNTVSSTGGAVQVVCEVPEGRGGSWSGDGKWIIFSPNISEPIFKVPTAGGMPVAVTNKKELAGTDRNPFFLPDGKTFLYVRRLAAKGELYAGSIDGPLERRILDNASNAQFANGYLLFVRDGNLVAQKFDPDALTLSGAPVALAEGVDYFEPRNIGNFAVSPTGVLAYREASRVPLRFAWFDREGREVETAGPAGAFLGGDLDRSGRKVVSVVGNSAAADVWILQRGKMSRVTFENLPLVSAVISPDGSQIAFASGGSGRSNDAWLQGLSGRPSKTALAKDSSSIQVTDWSADGRYVFVQTQNNATRFDISAIDLQGDRKLTPILQSPFEERRGTLSPDGRLLAYESNESGRLEIYATNFPDADRKIQISYDGGYAPRWSHDGKEIFFGSRGKLAAALRKAEDEFDVPVTLPLSIDTFSAVGMPYAVAADGRFLILGEAEKPAVNPIRVIWNWHKELP